MARLVDAGVLSELDFHFGRFMAHLDGTEDLDLFLAAALTSSATRQGHTCLKLETVAETQLLDKEKGRGKGVRCPTVQSWINKLSQSRVVGSSQDFKPLVLDEKRRLYLYRYWQYQQTLAEQIRARIESPEDPLDMQVLKAGMRRLFCSGDDGDTKTGREEVDWQQVAAFAALVNPFCLISGGPGTGKTTTVAKILALMLEQPCLKRSRLALAAPTGKAAARLQEAILQAKAELNCASEIIEAIPEEAFTIHRLLGTIPGSPYFRHHENNRLPVDILVVDEASMVDMALMAKLIQALPVRSRLILLGDKDQLSSVEAGAVVGDLCDAGGVHAFSQTFCRQAKETLAGKAPAPSPEASTAGIQDCLVQLEKNYRFEKGSGIAVLSHSVNQGRGDEAWAVLTQGKKSNARWQQLPAPAACFDAMKSRILQGFSDYLLVNDVQEAFLLFDRFRILCALREGPYGVRGLNALVERVFQKAGLIQPENRWYRGRPIMITRNDYHLGLFNGDVGILWPGSSDPRAHPQEALGTENACLAFFPGPHNALRRFHPMRLPAHETVFSMTVHKSQGSEFDDVMFVFPDRLYPVLTRELIYTGITRAKKGVEVWAEEEVFRAAVGQRTERMSGLSDALREGI